MPDAAHVVGGDLQLGPTGDLMLVIGSDETKQRILHRLLTSPGSYIWQLNYGAGLPALVGQAASRQQIAAIIKSQMLLEPTVATTPEPVVQVSVATLGDATASITYTDLGSNTDQAVSLSIGT